ncbi:MAG TPA: outer membrane lipoprotein carrier protein LolA [Acidobacteriota bacterium]|nr:outer membrane lipoprotein carrier protein LolA [Acidobacteriota bacterium]HRR25904.1 outer membrane lipoprotein carrier protein LolA [Acidobacteriota bacterium]HRV07972.1 outer membrane lipoprotein carrier protein LolA [Acidobacteriota bacterium]
MLVLRNLVVSFGCLAFFAAKWLAVPPTIVYASDLEDVLRGMGKVGSNLLSLRATIEQQRWTDLLEEYDEVEKGKFLFLRNDGKLYLRKEMTSPTPSSLVIRDDTVVFYQPGIKQAQEHKLGGRKDRAEFLLLGFGSDPEAIQEAYHVELAGEEMLQGGKAYHLVLKPKSDQVAAFFSRIELWIDAKSFLPSQQKLVEPTEDHLLIRFFGIEFNPPLRTSDFDLKLPSGVEVIRSN